METKRLGMVKRPYQRRGLCLSVFSAICVMLLLPVSYAVASVGNLGNLSGTVYTKAKGEDKWAVGLKDAALDVGYRVKTGPDGRAMLQFTDGTNLTIGNESEIEITEYLLKKNKRSATYSLSGGKVRAAVGKFSGKTDIKVKTPTSVSGVKGTDFIVMNQGPANVVFGEESKVQVSGEGSGKPVVITPGTMTENTGGTAPIRPEKVEPGTPLAEAREQLEAVTNVTAPVDWEKTGKLPMILARWNINYGHILTERKNFSGALDVLQISIDLTDVAEIRAKAHLERGTVLAKNMNEPERALAEFGAIIDKYPQTPSMENALYTAGMINVQLGRKDDARRLFERYLKDFPKGGHRGSIEIFLKDMDKN